MWYIRCDDRRQEESGEIVYTHFLDDLSRQARSPTSVYFEVFASCRRKVYLDERYLLGCGSKTESYSRRQILRSALTRESENRYVSFLHPYFKHFEIVIGYFLEWLRGGSNRKIVTLIIIDYVKVVQYLRCDNTSDQANKHVTFQSIV